MNIDIEKRINRNITFRIDRQEPPHWDEAKTVLKKLIKDTDDIDAIERLLSAVLGGVLDYGIKKTYKNPELQRREIKSSIERDKLRKKYLWVNRLIGMSRPGAEWWIDHIRVFQFKTNGRILIESEPYLDGDPIEKFKQLYDFCEKNNISCFISTQSQYFPGSTIRLSFLDKPLNQKKVCKCFKTAGVMKRYEIDSIFYTCNKCNNEVPKELIK